MDLATIPVDPAEARERLDQYTRMIADERTAEDKAIAAGYRAAARGLPLISLRRTITGGGWHDNGLPRIAVVRADATECFARWDQGDVVFADVDDRNVNRRALVNQRSVRIEIPADDRPPMDRRSWRAACTMVPLIPPKFRPRPWRLRGCHLLWEVESWTWIPPEDPALIKHVRGDLFAVLAVWDLTKLERAVLAQR